MPTTSSMCEVRSVPGAGQGLFASQDLPASAPVIEDASPLVAVLDSPTLTTACSWCFFYPEEAAEDDKVKLSACTGCRIARYCGKVCQSAAWKHSHKYECKIYAKLYPNVLPNSARMVLQLLLRRKHEVLPGDEWAGFLDLRHHLNEFKVQAQNGDETLQNIQLMARAGAEYSGSTEDLGLVETLVGRLLINTLTLMSPLFTPLGLLLSLPISRCNHSCEPTAIPTLSRRALTLRTLAPAPAGAELTLSYTDITVAPADRRAALRARYHFDCACPACRAGRTLGRPDPPPAFAALPPGPIDAAVARANELLLAAAQTADPRARLAPLARALAALPHGYPAYRPPLSRVRAELIRALLARRRWTAALVQALAQRADADPVVFAAADHPACVARAWVLARLLAQAGGAASDAADDGGEARAARALEARFEVAFPLALFVLVRDVADRAERSHGAESQLALEAQRELERLRGEVRAMGGQEPKGEVVEGVWRGLSSIAEEGWEWWKDWERGHGDRESEDEGVRLLLGSASD